MAGDTDRFPDGHVTLITQDGGTTVNLMLCDQRGKKSNLAISRSAYPRMSTRISQGDDQYSDLEPPYMGITQDDWAGGRAAEEFERDRTRYFDSGRVNTEISNQVILGPQETFTTGYTDIVTDMPGSLTWWTLQGQNLFMARTVTPSALINAPFVYVWIKKVGAPSGDLTCAWYTTSGGNMGSIIQSQTLATADYKGYGDAPVLHRFNFTNSLSSGVTYALSITDEGNSADASNYWEVGAYDAGGGGFISLNGTVWNADDNVIFHHTQEFYLEDNRYRFFEYKRAMYMVKTDTSGSNSELWLNGDRGTADSNTGALTRVIDGSKSWTSDAYNGAVVLITRGPGSEEEQPWRTITDTNSTWLSVTPGWEVEHTTSTEYVILGANTWQQIRSDLEGQVTDIALGGDFVYFALGENVTINRFQGYSTGGIWTRRYDLESVSAAHLLVINHPEEGDTLWGGSNENNMHGTAVFKAHVPPGWQDLHVYGGKLAPTNKVWADIEDEASNLVFDLANGDTHVSIPNSFTGDFMALNIPATDLRVGDAIGCWCKSSAAMGYVSLSLSSMQYAGQQQLADQVLFFTKSVAPSAFVINDGSAYWPYEGPTVDDTRYQAKFTLQTTHEILIGYSEPFSAVNFDFALANTTNSVLAARYWTGQGWTTVVSLADGTNTTPPSGPTFGQSGQINWTLGSMRGWDKGTDAADSNVNEALYWVKLTVGANLTEVKIQNILLEGWEVYQYRNLNEAKDAGDDSKRITFHQNDYLYVGHGQLFDSVVLDLGSTFNAVTTDIAAQYFNGELWTALAIDSDGTASGGVTWAQDGTIALDMPGDAQAITVNGVSAYWVRFEPASADMTAYTHINEVAVKAPEVENTISIVTADVWDWVYMEITAAHLAKIGSGGIQSVSFRVSASPGAFTWQVHGGIKLFRGGVEWIGVGDKTHRINNLIGYGSEIRNPWVLKEDKPYEIQTQNGNQVVELPLGEIEGLKSERSGRAAAVNDVYLYFSLGRFLERYFDRSLEDVGPNRDAGLPTLRQGDVVKVLSYPGKIFQLVDAGDTGISSILVRSGGGQHDFYQGVYTERMNDAEIQVIPGLIDRLWVSVGATVLWLPLPDNTMNPRFDGDYRFTHEGYLVTGWIDAGFKDIEKLYSTLKLYTENLATGVRIQTYYQIESGTLSDTWTYFGDYSTSPFEEIDFAANPTVLARRLRLMFILQTNDNTTTPVLKASVIEAILKQPVKYAFTGQFLIADKKHSMQGVRNYTVMAETDLAQLDTWANGATVLTMRMPYSVFDNKKVVLEPVGVKPIALKPRGQNPNKPWHERHIGEFTLLEV